MKILKKAISICSIVLALSACINKQVGSGPVIDLNNDGIPDSVVYENITSDMQLGGEHYDINSSKVHLFISKKIGDDYQMEDIDLGPFSRHVNEVFYPDINSDKLLDIGIEFSDGEKYFYLNNGNDNFVRQKN